MVYSSKFDKRFFYHFMMTHGRRKLPDIFYLWECFISGDHYWEYPDYDPIYFKPLESFERLYGRFYKKRNLDILKGI